MAPWWGSAEEGKAWPLESGCTQIQMPAAILGKNLPDTQCPHLCNMGDTTPVRMPHPGDMRTDRQTVCADSQ